ncbi:hypothetical protein Scep_010210 [Stephania cephalantha]|uniref:Uncharacterized protein n=1 Tax=Stephania cephalantha TaxID=152367 RepID=A0AAP0PF01_9MAGN
MNCFIWNRNEEVRKKQPLKKQQYLASVLCPFLSGFVAYSMEWFLDLENRVT